VPGTGGVSSDGAIGPSAAVLAATPLPPGTVAVRLPVVPTLDQHTAGQLAAHDNAFSIPPPPPAAHASWRERTALAALAYEPVSAALDGIGGGMFEDREKEKGLLSASGRADLAAKLRAPASCTPLRFTGWGAGEEFSELRHEVPAVLPSSAQQVGPSARRSASPRTANCRGVARITKTVKP
jgi:hypothetical protein